MNVLLIGMAVGWIGVCAGDEPVDYGSHFGSMDRLAKVVHQVSGSQIVVPAKYRQRVVYMSSGRYPAESIAHCLGEILDADVRKTANGYEIVASRKKEKEARADAVSRSASAIDTQLRLLQKSLGDSNDWMRQAEEAIRTFDITSRDPNGPPTLATPNPLTRLSLPGERLLRSALVAIGSKTLAAIPKGGYRVYSSSPNVYEVAFPPSVQPQIEGYRQVQHALALIGQRLTPANKWDEEWWQEILRRASSTTDDLSVFLVARGSENRRISAQVGVFSDQGSVLSIAAEALPRFEPSIGPLPKLKSLLGSKTTLDPEDADLARSVVVDTTGRFGFSDEKPADAIRQRAFAALKPTDGSDLLAAVCKPALDSLAAASQKPLIVDATDSLANAILRARQGRNWNVDRLLASLADVSGTTERDVDGIHVLKSGLNSELEADRSDRKPLAKLIASTLKGGHLNPIEWCRYAYEGGEASSDVVGVGALALCLMRLAGLDVPGPHSFRVLKEATLFVGSIPSSAWNENQVDTDLHSLGPVSQSLFWRWAESFLSTVHPSGEQAWSPRFALLGTRLHARSPAPIYVQLGNSARTCFDFRVPARESARYFPGGVLTLEQVAESTAGIVGQGVEKSPEAVLSGLFNLVEERPLKLVVRIPANAECSAIWPGPKTPSVLNVEFASLPSTVRKEFETEYRLRLAEWRGKP